MLGSVCSALKCVCVWECCQNRCVFWCYRSNRVWSFFSLWLSLPFLFTHPISLGLTHFLSTCCPAVWVTLWPVLLARQQQNSNTPDIRLTFLFFVIWFPDQALAGCQENDLISLHIKRHDELFQLVYRREKKRPIALGHVTQETHWHTSTRDNSCFFSSSNVSPWWSRKGGLARHRSNRAPTLCSFEEKSIDKATLDV